MAGRDQQNAGGVDVEASFAGHIYTLVEVVGTALTDDQVPFRVRTCIQRNTQTGFYPPVLLFHKHHRK